MKIETILDQIDLGAMALPEFQRGYVWRRRQVRSLMDSLYRRHPVGGLLVWITRTEDASARGDGALAAGFVKLLLDGQQRITSLYGIVRGHPPEFFDGDPSAFADLFFHLEDERFEFYATARMQSDPLWVSVTSVFAPNGVGEAIQRVVSDPDVAGQVGQFSQRLTRLNEIRSADFHVDEVTGEDKTVDVVVEIFNRVNSGGTKLSKGDLALAKVCAEWPGARAAMKQRLEKWRAAGFEFRLDWLLRNVNTVVTGEAMFTALKDAEPSTVRTGLESAERMVDTFLNMLGGRLGLDHDRVLGARGAIPLVSRFLADRGGRISSMVERDKLLYWYVHALLWGRYAGSTETVLNQDLALIEESEGAVDRLIAALRQVRGDLTIRPEDFIGWSRGARFYPLLYMLTRVCKARDFDTGVELAGHLLGRQSRLELHHVFPKALLYRHDYARPEVNALANFTFLTQETNIRISDRDAADYLPEFEERNPGVLASHWIPEDPDLWRPERYLDFLETRRELLATTANDFLNGLVHGNVPEEEVGPTTLDPAGRPVAPEPTLDEEQRVLADCNAWLHELGLPQGEPDYELVDNADGRFIAVLDLAWPQGLQPELSEPVALLIDEPPGVHDAALQAGIRPFSDLVSFRAYVEGLGHDVNPEPVPA